MVILDAQWSVVQDKFNDYIDCLKEDDEIKEENVEYLKKTFSKITSDQKTPQECIKLFSKKIRKLQKSSLISEETADKVTTKATKILSRVKSADTNIFTTRIKDPEELSRLGNILDKWKEQAQKRSDKAEKQKLLSHQLITDDSLFIIKRLQEEINHGRVYVAFDINNEVQAMASVTCNKQHMHINSMATNPNNIVIFGNEKPVRGAGTAIIRHITQDTLKKSRESIRLTSLSSAVEFYEKLGFVEDKNGTAILSELKMKSLLNSTKNISTILKRNRLGS